MTAKFFGQYLLEKGIINREQFLDAVKLQKTIDQPLCAAAIKKGFLEDGELAKLDPESCSDTNFLRIVEEKKLLTTEQIEEISREQYENWIFFGEALVRNGALAPSRLGPLFEEYREDASEPDALYSSIPESTPERLLVSQFLKATIDIFIHYTRKIVRVESVTPSSSEISDGVYIFTQEVVGDKNLLFVMAMQDELVRIISKYMMGTAADEVGPLELDAVAEFVNIVVGNSCVKLNMNQCKVEIKPPQIMTMEMLKKRYVADAVSIQLETAKGQFVIEFFFPAADKGEQAGE